MLSELWGSSTGAGGDVFSSLTSVNGGLCGRGLGGVIRLFFGLEGRLGVAFSVEVSTVEEAGLVRRRRRGPVLAPSWGRARRGGGGGLIRRGIGR